jgi:hypothetical protein
MKIIATITTATVFGTISTLALLSSSPVVAFPLIRISSSCDSNRMGFRRASKIALYATKPKQGKKQKKKASGGGFGVAVKITGKAAASEGKVRTVSGVTGSGTKPLRIAANTFDAIRKKYEAASTSDVYVKAPLNDPKTFWFVGKVNRRLDIDDEELVGLSVPTEAEAVLSQKRLILEYSKTKLRPQNLGGPFAKDLEIWTAPGDSEMDVVKNLVRYFNISCIVYAFIWCCFFFLEKVYSYNITCTEMRSRLKTLLYGLWYLCIYTHLFLLINITHVCEDYPCENSGVDGRYI